MELRILKYSSFALLLSFLWSCTKEEDIYEDRKGEDVTEIITDQSKNKILSYKIINPGQKQRGLASYAAGLNLASVCGNG